MLLAPVAFLVVATLPRAATPIASAVRPGCYRFDRPLGASATGALERGDSSWYRVQLLVAGAVARPALSNAYWRDQYAARSAWHERADTLFVRLSTGLVGWDLTLLARGDDYVGTARYLSDATGGPPYIVSVHGVREACLHSPPTQGTLKPTKELLIVRAPPTLLCFLARA